MNETLLPAGCYDVLPPYARLESQLVHRLLGHFESYGYEQVSPPLIEYAESLLAGRGGVLSKQVIRVMDPATQRMMGIRSDMTLQIGRIASHRMADAHRPLRLCYAGSVLRMQASATNEKRQLLQTGIELIGHTSPEADAEVMIVALRALQAAGIGHITIDLNLPVFIGTLLADSSLDNDELSMVFEALAHKDSTRLKQFQEPVCDLLCELMLVSGEATEALTVIENMELPIDTQPHIAYLKQVMTLLAPHESDHVHVTLDVTERGGLDYYSGVSFAFFATEKQVEIGRGGRYIVYHQDERESAIGCTFYVDSLHRLMPAPGAQNRVYVVDRAEEGDITRLHAQGYVTVLALEDAGDADVRNVARRHRCGFVYQSGKLKEL